MTLPSEVFWCWPGGRVGGCHLGRGLSRLCPLLRALALLCPLPGYLPPLWMLSEFIAVLAKRQWLHANRADLGGPKRMCFPMSRICGFFRSQCWSVGSGPARWRHVVNKTSWPSGAHFGGQLAWHLYTQAGHWRKERVIVYFQGCWCKHLSCLSARCNCRGI